MNDWFLIEVIDGGHDSIPEFPFGFDTDVAQHRPREFGKKALDEIEPGAVRRRESQLEAAGGLLGEPGLGLFGYVSRVIVENELDGCVSWIGGIDKLRNSMNS